MINIRLLLFVVGSFWIFALELLQEDLSRDLQRAREDLAVAELALTYADLAFSDLTNAHRELQDLHRESLDWGPLRAPRDCVREVILLDETAWPFDTDGQLAYCLKAQEWCEDERERLNQDLDACFDVNFPQQRPQRDDPRDGDADSSWITWPEGHVIEPFPYLEGEDQ